MKRLNKRNRILLGVVAVGTMVVGAVFLQILAGRFDRDTWLAHSDPSEINNPRLTMEADLINHRLRSGLTTVQVIRLLGPPDDTVTDRRRFVAYLETDPHYGLTPAEAERTQVIYRYCLGVPVIDPVSLCLQIDRSGRLGRAWQASH
jgi:hypothetical protein